MMPDSVVDEMVADYQFQTFKEFTVQQEEINV